MNREKTSLCISVSVHAAKYVNKWRDYWGANLPSLGASVPTNPEQEQGSNSRFPHDALLNDNKQTLSQLRHCQPNQDTLKVNCWPLNKPQALNSNCAWEIHIIYLYNVYIYIYIIWYKYRLSGQCFHPHRRSSPWKQQQQSYFSFLQHLHYISGLKTSTNRHEEIYTTG